MARPNILDRFRPVGAPGPAGPAGVPAVDGTGVAAELAPVFAALEADVDACARLVATAAQEAEAATARAHARALAMVSEARLGAGAARASSAAAVQRSAAQADARVLEEAADEAHAIAESGTAQLDVTARKVIDALLVDQGVRRA